MNPRPADIARWWQFAPSGQVVVDGKGYTVLVNHTLSDWLGFPSEQLVNRLASELFTCESRMVYQGVLAYRVADVGSVSEVHLSLNLSNGDTLPVLCSARRLGDQKDPQILISMQPIVRKDQLERELLEARQAAQTALEEKEAVITELESMRTTLKSHNEELQRLTMRLGHEAKSDPLTGLPNRRHLDVALKELLSRAEGFLSEGFCMALLDIDHFKPVNDEYGHAVGDQVLQQLAKLLSSKLRGQDFAARIGGEEFALLMPKTAIDEASNALERLRQAIEVYHWQPVPITVSLGVTSYLPEDTSETLLARADRALYTAKREGRNRLVNG
ncbi:PAS domain S-box-containing protein/diguanylate cyclase (GGDEF) domain-containing protein [Vreelandella subterranea]|uniref:diguanylate cyclase n=1 Tax=Vreelandella subterranea TaxID=416874 RepID=A0A1H9V1G5_9GAMM|nr:sensor domain-containing diguanylate cyclase [Halomonas subterranea]SES15512.1 PAS domain S-box-containing protein/diguanylate cyclase (GGDEF) domain-containing protein [Halomonas subterranea]